jgi:hypothetical protein
MDYTLTNVANKINEFADKIGSDYYPLPVVLDFFETSSYDFIGERLKHIEKTQEITDDISSLIKTSWLTVGQIATVDVNEPVKYGAAIPTDYLRKVAYDVYYADGSRCRRADLKRHGELMPGKNNPYRAPSKNYPIILQEENLFKIDAGAIVADRFYLIYCKKPTFATVGTPSTRAVNLPDDAIEKVILKTLISLYGKTADQRAAVMKEIEDSYRKAFR